MHTVVSAELVTIYKTILWIDDGNLNNDRYVIFTDSLVSVYMLRNGCKSYSNIIVKIHKLVHKLTNMVRLIKFQLIPPHEIACN